MNAITPTAMPINDMQTLALAIAKSGLFGIKTPDQALVLMAIAQAEGRHPVEAARDYDIIQGRPAKKAEAMMRDFIQAGGKVEWHELSDQRADATFTHPQTGSVRIDWDMQRAVTAFGKKEMYGKFPRQMLRSRVVSEGVRTLWPLATSGMYVPEEAVDIPAKPEHNGPTLEHEPEPLRAAAAATPRGDRVVDPTVYDAPKPHPLMPNGAVDPNPMDMSKPQKLSWSQWGDSLEVTARETPDDALGRVLARAEVGEIKRLAEQGTYSPAKARILEAIREMEERYNAYVKQPADDLPGADVDSAAEPAHA